MQRHVADIAALLAQSGGSYASALGIALDDLRNEELFKWLLAAVLYGAPISESLASRTWREFAANGVLSPQRILQTGWEGLVRLLDRGGYTRYDYKTATKLLELSRHLLDDYGGDLNALHAAADPIDLARRIMGLAKGVGPITAAIFLRELRGRWGKSELPLSPLALAAAQQLGLVQAATDAAVAQTQLRALWRHTGHPDDTFRELETALVRAALQKRHAAR